MTVLVSYWPAFALAIVGTVSSSKLKASAWGDLVILMWGWQANATLQESFNSCHIAIEMHTEPLLAFLALGAVGTLVFVVGLMGRTIKFSWVTVCVISVVALDYLFLWSVVAPLPS